MGPRKIFFVDDEKDILDIYQAALSSRIELKTFTNPVDLIAAVKAGERPDVYVTDMKMPQMTGIDLIKWLREQQIHNPCLIISGYAEKAQALQAMKLGMVELLEKPFSVEYLRIMIRRGLLFSIYMELEREVGTIGPRFVQLLSEAKQGSFDLEKAKQEAESMKTLLALNEELKATLQI